MIVTVQDWTAHLRACAGEAAVRVASPDAHGSSGWDLPPVGMELPGPDQIVWHATRATPPVATAAAATAAPAAVAAAATAAIAAAAADALLRARPGSSLSAVDGFHSLEVWTECELSALHALWRLCRLQPSPMRRARLAELRAWHLQHTQPDNATNRPWALHVFLAAGDPESLLYAQTLLHNVTVSQARHEPLTRWILADSAAELERMPPGASLPAHACCGHEQSPSSERGII